MSPFLFLVLGGCHSCTIANEFTTRGSRCVLCYNVEMPMGINSQIIKEFFKNLCELNNGKHVNTIKKSFDDAVNTQQKILQATFLGKPMREIVELRCTGNYANQTLDRITGEKPR